MCVLDAAVVSGKTDGLLCCRAYVIIRVRSILSVRGAVNLCLWAVCSRHQVLWIQGGLLLLHYDAFTLIFVLCMCLDSRQQSPNWLLETFISLGSLTVLRFFVFVRFIFFHACMLYYCNTVMWAWWDWELSGWLTTLLQCFDTAGRIKMSSLKWPVLCWVGR